MTEEIKVSGNYSVSSYPTAKLLCLNGNGIARLPYLDVKEEIKQGKLIQLFSNYQLWTHPLYIAYPRNQYRSKVKNEFKELLINWFKKQNEFFI